MKEKIKILDKNNDKLKLRKIVKKQKSKERGITLIALVITIIILLILAGVTLNIALSDNGLFNKTKKATEDYKTATDEEQRQIAMAEAAMNLDGKEYKSKYNNKEVTVPIPAGFAVSGVDGENTVEDGLVIIDSDGNEFVWIPVENVEQYVRNPDYINYEKAQADKDYLPDELVRGQSLNEEELEKELVAKSGGFYVGRYEAGVSGNVVIDPETDLCSGDPTVVCKKNVHIYNNVTQVEAKSIAKTFINNDSVKSALISGIQWDVVMGFVDGSNDGVGNKFDVKVFNENRHNPSSSILGLNENDRVKNIYDLEGNFQEYNAERIIWSENQTNDPSLRRRNL